MSVTLTRAASAFQLVPAQRCTNIMHEPDGVDGPGRARVAVEVYFVVQVRAGGVAAGADQSDDLADDDLPALFDEGSLAHVAVAGDDAAGVGDVDVPSTACDLSGAVAVAAVLGKRDVAAHHGHHAGRGGVDWGAAWRTEVDPVSSCSIAVSV